MQVAAASAVDPLRYPALSSINQGARVKRHLPKTGAQAESHQATRVTDPATLRFAIAAFDTWAEAQKVAQQLNAGGKALNNVSYLG